MYELVVGKVEQSMQTSDRRCAQSSIIWLEMESALCARAPARSYLVIVVLVVLLLVNAVAALCIGNDVRVAQRLALLAGLKAK